MKIWIINPFDNLPQEGFRPQRYWLMSEALKQRGHEVTLWTSDFNHGLKRRRETAGNSPDWVRMVKTLSYAKNVSARRVLSHWLLAKAWTKAAEAEKKLPDAMVVSMPPLGLAKAAVEFGNRHGIKTVVDVQDAWPETFGRVLPEFIVRPLKRIARNIYLGADAISAVAGKYADLAKGYGAKCKMKVTGHCKNRPWGLGWSQPSLDDSAVRMCYVGNMGRSYDLKTVVEAVKELEGVTLDLAGDGEQRKELEALAKGCDRIRFHGYLPERELAETIARCNVGVVPMFKDSQVAVPGKLADYGVAELKVVYSLEGEIKMIAGEAGVKYEAGDKESFKAAVKEVARLEHGLKREDFDAEKLMGEYGEWLEGICAQA